LAYTNHTILPEALEKWQLLLFEQVLPRHTQIIYEINQRFLSQIRLTATADDAVIRKLSIIEEYPVKSVRMANLAIVGSHSVNGVSALHTDILKHSVFKEFYQLYPQRFNNRTNGITPRRWLMLCNPKLTELISKAIGTAWKTDLMKLAALNEYKHDNAFLVGLGRDQNAEQAGFLPVLFHLA